ncbi:MAG: hypothetical protein R3E90_14150 [Marinicella sp.]
MVYADVHDRNIVDGDIRSEYAFGLGTGNDYLNLSYANNGLHGEQGCLFDASADPVFSCAGFRSNNPSDWQGNTQTRSACGGDTTPIGDSWLGCLSYSDSPYFSIGNPQTNDYWVIHANHDPSFDQCRVGPPSLSQPIANHEIEPEKIFNISTTDVVGENKKQINVKINASQLNPYCDNVLEPGLPFLSVGSHKDAGNMDVVATVPALDAGYADFLKFKMKLGDYIPFDCTELNCPQKNPAGSHAGFFVIAEWESAANPGDPDISYPKFVWIELFGSGVISDATNANSTTKWNWPIADSMFWPGGEIAFLGAHKVSECVGIDIEPLSLFGFYTDYNVNLTELFKCANEFNRFQDPIPESGFDILGVHFFVEAANATTGELEISVKDIKIDTEIIDLIFKDDFES